MDRDHSRALNPHLFCILPDPFCRDSQEVDYSGGNSEANKAKPLKQYGHGFEYQLTSRLFCLFLPGRLMMQIEGIPDGWEPVRFDYAANGEQYLTSCGDVTNHTSAKSSGIKRLIIRKIEKYRPFANTAEAEVMWDAKLQLKEHSDDKFRVTAIRVTGVVIGASWYNYEEAFERFECVDGTPFGVEVTE